MDFDPGHDEGTVATPFMLKKVRILVGPVGAKQHELVELGEVDALEIAPNVTGGSLTLHGIDAEKLSAHVGNRGGIQTNGDIIAATRASWGGVSQAWHEAMASTAEQMREVLLKFKEIGCQVNQMSMGWDTYNRLNQRPTKRGAEATKWIQSLTPGQRSGLRLISQPMTLKGQIKREAKKRRIQERKLTSWYRSFHRLSA